MEVKVGITHAAREVMVETEATAAEVEAAFAEALANRGVFTLTEDRGRKVLIPAERVAYLDLGQEHARRVGFGAV